MTLHLRWLGRVAYRDAHALQRGLYANSAQDHLLLLEHPPVYTLGVRADPANVLRAPGALGAELVRVDRGGDVTYHGPGQLVGYPILTVPGKRGGGMADTAAYVRSVEQLVLDVLGDLGVTGIGRLAGHPGVWVGPETGRPRKVCAVGVRLSRGRSMHGFALNVHTDLSMFDRIVPCGIAGKAVTSLAAEGLEVTMREVVDAVAERAAQRWGAGGWDRAEVAWTEPGESPGAGTPSVGPRGATGLSISSRKPAWLRAQVHHDAGVLALRHRMRGLDLVTVCEEAGCPNLSECWSDGTATFMINGQTCTRSCGFCLVGTGRPPPADPAEPQRVAEAVAGMGLAFAVVTAVARDDLPDGGAGGFVETIRAIRRRSPGTAVEVLVPDFKGDPAALEAVFAERPEVLNHNLETVARLQRAVRPSAAYARSLAVLARAKAAGLITKSSLMAGLGETREELLGALADLRGVGADIVTIGQYLRPSAAHLPVARWWAPAELDEFKQAGEAMGIGHVEAGPLVRSSYHARSAAEAARPAGAHRMPASLAAHA